jgi:hypothetical protein
MRLALLARFPLSNAILWFAIRLQRNSWEIAVRMSARMSEQRALALNLCVRRGLFAFDCLSIYPPRYREMSDCLNTVNW